MAKTVATIIGALFVFVGLVGFVAPNMMGMHLSATHNIVHLVSGALALYFGIRGSPSSARTFCFIFGAVYGLLGLVGLIFGSPGTVPMHGYAEDERVFSVIPGALVLGTADHVVHILLGVVLLVSAMFTRTVGVKTEVRHA